MRQSWLKGGLRVQSGVTGIKHSRDTTNAELYTST